MLDQMPADNAAAVIEDLPEARAEQVRELLPEAQAEEIQKLLEYGEQHHLALDRGHPRGGHSGPGHRRHPGAGVTADEPLYLYVLDSPHRRVGVASLRRLLTALPTAVLKLIATPDVVCVPPTRIRRRWPSS